tara:strand:- start:20 stop:496 length:477 start_codon:yes stop_codon:yes gene_type:complete
MKLILKILIILGFVSCTSQIQTDSNEIEDKRNEIEIYQSSDDSFQPGFYLTIKDKQAIVYGWETENESDTVYYKSTCELKEDSSKSIRITLESYQLSEVKITQDNLNEFQENKNLKMPIWRAHSSFWGHKADDGSLEFMAVKHSYDSRADNFIFKRIK